MGRRCVLLAVVLVLGVSGCGSGRGEPSPAPAGAGSASTRPGPLALLHEWDARRADAWASSDDAALRRLYVPGSRAGAADVALLRRYRARGIVVRDLRMQVLAFTVLARTPRLLRLRVTDRVASAEIVGTGAGSLPRDSALTRTLELHRSGGVWRMGRVCSGEC